MPIDAKWTRDLAQRLRIRLKAKESLRLARELEELISGVNEIFEADLSEVEPLQTFHEPEHALREDIPRPGLNKEQVFSNKSGKTSDFFEAEAPHTDRPSSLEEE